MSTDGLARAAPRARSDKHPPTVNGSIREVPADTPTGADLERIIGFHARRIRATQRLTMSEAADRIGISKAMLSKIENAQTSCSLSTLSRLAAGFDVPLTSLLRGADSKRDAVFTAAGTGGSMVGRGTRHGHHYELLGTLRGENKRLEPVVVTLTSRSEIYPRFQHPGTELLYMLEGEMSYVHGDTTYAMKPGDSLLLDGEGVHGPVSMDELPIRFLSITAYPENDA